MLTGQDRSGPRALVYLGPGTLAGIPSESVTFLSDEGLQCLAMLDVHSEVGDWLARSFPDRAYVLLTSLEEGLQLRTEANFCLLFTAEHAQEIADWLECREEHTGTLLVPGGLDLRREITTWELALLYDLTVTLRRECPWDRAQTLESIMRYTLEETYELLDAVLRSSREAGAGDAVCGELGDLLFQVYFLTRVAEEMGWFTLARVARDIRVKLVRRHPHIFADGPARTAEDVRRTWDHIKRHVEGRSGVFHHVPDALPSLLYAQKLQARAAEVGFDWPDALGPLEKVDEELEELRRELECGAPAAVQNEVGDVLFALVNVARKLRVDPEIALREASNRFKERVNRAVELASHDGLDWSSLSLDDQECYYQKAKEALSNVDVPSSCAQEDIGAHEDT